MKKLIMVFICLLFAALQAIDDKKNGTMIGYQIDVGNKENINQRQFLLPSASRSKTPLTSPESSDDEEESSDQSESLDDSSSDDESSHDASTMMSHNSLMKINYDEKPAMRKLLERYGRYFFGGACCILIVYKIQRAGYLL